MAGFLGLASQPRLTAVMARSQGTEVSTGEADLSRGEADPVSSAFETCDPGGP